MYGGVFDWDASVQKLEELTEKAADPALWEDAQAAQHILKEKTALESSVGKVRELDQSAKDAVEMVALAQAEGDEDLIQESLASLQNLKKQAEKLQLQSLLSGEADLNDCFVEIHPGAGGTESQDWAQMLYRMYTRWAEQHDYKLEYLEESPGEEAGIKSATFKVSGPYAYGWMKTESGVHRLVRISPFDSNARRHTSFASVWVYPVIDESFDIVVEEKDLRIDTYRSSGAGGQHVNTTDSAVRITHLPTKIVVQCQSNRSQHRNRAEAMAMLKARLYEMELQKREAQAQDQNAQKTDIGWGSQIRSYVLHPYQMVKDLRTNVETGNTQAVLDGDLDMFMEGALAAKS